MSQVVLLSLTASLNPTLVAATTVRPPRTGSLFCVGGLGVTLLIGVLARGLLEWA